MFDIFVFLLSYFEIAVPITSDILTNSSLSIKTEAEGCLYFSKKICHVNFNNGKKLIKLSRKSNCINKILIACVISIKNQMQKSTIDFHLLPTHIELTTLGENLKNVKDT